MQITATFYSFSKRENSTQKPASGGTAITVTFKEETNILNPTIELHYASAFTFNYCYIDFTGRYYRVSSVDSIALNTYLVTLEVDVLATYRDDVKGQTVYAELSSYDYDELLDDPRIDTHPHIERDEAFAEEFVILPAHTAVDSSIYQFMSVINKQGRLNGIDIFFGLGDVLITNFLQKIADENWVQQIWNGISGGSPIDVVNELWWSPLIPQQCHAVADQTAQLYDVNITGRVLASPDVIKHHTTIDVPKPSVTDFRYSEKYVRYYLEIPFVGITTIPTELLRDRSKIEIAYAGDCLTGQMAVAPKVGNCNLGIFGTSLKAPLGLARQQSHVAQLISQGAIGAGAGWALGAKAGFGLAGAALMAGAGVARGIGTMPDIEKTGTAVGSIAPFGCRDTVGVCALRMIECDSSIDPATLAAIAGRPAQKITTVQNGYIKTINASVSFAGTADEIRQFNSLLNGGIYVE